MVYVTNLPDGADDRNIVKMFEKFGRILQSFQKDSYKSLSGGIRGQPGLVIEYDSETSAEKATFATLQDQIDKRRLYKIWWPTGRLLGMDWPSLVSVADRVQMIVASGSKLLSGIPREHELRYGTPLEPAKYGFSTVLDFLNAMPQVLQLKKCRGEVHVFWAKSSLEKNIRQVCKSQVGQRHEVRSAKRPSATEFPAGDARKKPRRSPEIHRKVHDCRIVETKNVHTLQVGEFPPTFKPETKQTYGQGPAASQMAQLGQAGQAAVMDTATTAVQKLEQWFVREHAHQGGMTQMAAAAAADGQRSAGSPGLSLCMPPGIHSFCSAISSIQIDNLNRVGRPKSSTAGPMQLEATHAHEPDAVGSPPFGSTSNAMTIHEKALAFWEQTSGASMQPASPTFCQPNSPVPLQQRYNLPQTHKVFVGGLKYIKPTVHELLAFFEGKFGRVADVWLPSDDPSTGEGRGFAFVIFQSQQSADAACTERGVHQETALHEFRRGVYIEVKRATAKRVEETGSGRTPQVEQLRTLPTSSNVCLDCGKKNPKYGLPQDGEPHDTRSRKPRWCGDCKVRAHPDAVKTRTEKESMPHPAAAPHPFLVHAPHSAYSPPTHSRRGVAKRERGTVRSGPAAGPVDRVQVGPRAGAAALRVLDDGRRLPERQKWCGQIGQHHSSRIPERVHGLS
jgi:hypothetical protein